MGGGRTLVQHSSTFSTDQSLVLIIYDIFSMIINSSQLYCIPDTVQTLSHLWRLWSPAGPIGVSPAYSIKPPPSLFFHISNWVLFIGSVITGDSMIGAVASQSLMVGKLVYLSAVCFTFTNHICKYYNNVCIILVQYQSSFIVQNY